MKPLTPRQQAVLDFVCRFSRERGFSPSLREIGEAVGLANVSAVRGHVAALQRKGYLAREPDIPRSINVVKSPSLISRIKRTLHRYARSDEGVLHRVRYGVVLATHGLRPLFAGQADQVIERAFERLRIEHGWTFIETRVEPDHLAVVVEVWPNHAPELVARRMRAAAHAALRRAKLAMGTRVWARGYAVTTDPDELDGVVEQFLASCRRTREE